MDRPECNSKAPDTTQPIEMLQYLLDIEMKRLETAVRIENERNIVFPETIVIIRDIQKLMGAIYGENKKPKNDSNRKRLLPSEIVRNRNEQ